MRYIELHLTDHCNLNCVGCSHFSPLSKPYFKDVVEFEKEMKRLSELTNIDTIRLMGGEPLLHPEWLKFCEITRKYFPYSEIVLVTNGTLLEKIDAKRINELDITVCLSDYMLNLNRKKFFEIKKVQTHYKGDLYNISLDLNGSQDERTAFDNCDLHIHKWYFFKDGRLYPCCVMPNVHIFLEHFGIEWEYNEDDIGIDIFTHSIDEIEEFLDKPIKLCKYCNTIARSQSKVRYCKSKGDIREWLT